MSFDKTLDRAAASHYMPPMYVGNRQTMCSKGSSAFTFELPASDSPA